MRTTRTVPHLMPRALLFLGGLLLATTALCRPATAQDMVQGIYSRTVKVHIRYAQAAEISEAFGGGVTGIGSPSGRPLSAPYSGSAANLLPDGIQSVTALVPDNSLIIRYDTDDALREIREIIRILDVKPHSVAIRAVATLTITDSAGRKQKLVLRAEGLATGERRLHLKTSAESDPKGAGLLPVICTSDADLAARPFGDYSLNVVSDWYIDIAWRTSGSTNSTKPIRLKNVYRTDTVVENGGTATVTRATLKIPSGTAELILQLTAQLATDLPDAAAPSTKPIKRVTKP